MIDQQATQIVERAVAAAVAVPQDDDTNTAAAAARAVMTDAGTVRLDITATAGDQHPETAEEEEDTDHDEASEARGL